MTSAPESVDQVRALLSKKDYIAGGRLSTAVFLALSLKRPLFLEGEAGVGKTELASALAAALERRLIRLQCHEGLDLAGAAYEWNHARQILAIRLAEAEGRTRMEGLSEDLYSREFLIERPLLKALSPSSEGPPVLLVDELDRADEPFEAYLLEFLADFRMSIPELGDIAAVEPPIVVLTSNRTREVHDALKRRCLYCWVDYPTQDAEERILAARVPGLPRRAAGQGRGFRSGAAQGRPVQGARRVGNVGLGRSAHGHAGSRGGCPGRVRNAWSAAQIPGGLSAG